jgi:para-aminobenzoate synthetase component 1
MLNWVNQFSIFCFLDNQQYNNPPHKYECILAAGAASSVNSNESSLRELDVFLYNKTWKLGHIAYDLKECLHQIPSRKINYVGFPHFFFFTPQILLILQDNRLQIHADVPDEVFHQCMDQQVDASSHHKNASIQPRVTKSEYISIISKLQQHIQRGDCYEINFCQEFYVNDLEIDVSIVFDKLMQTSPNPFSALYRLHDKFLICASPERFLTCEGDTILSQPMKGTAKRNVNNKDADKELLTELFNNKKERAENVMVVDLVRNDLSRICIENSVKVDELYEIYSFPQVHQMVSTVSGKLSTHVPFSEILFATFPMGSMTGAPKYRVMELIEQYELSSRGIFSGSVGYMDPDNNFDFNVVIRSIMYNATKKYLSYQVGSGITIYSDAEKEWEECLLKAEAIIKVLTNSM